MARPNTTTTGQIVPRNQQQEKPTLAKMLNGMQAEIARALPKHVRPERIMRICQTALRTNPQLNQCSPVSFLGSVMSAAQLGLEPNTPLGHCSLIPFRNHGTMEAQLVLEYQGMMELARRSGDVTAIYAFEVMEGDEFSYELGLEPKLHHVPSSDADREDRPLTHVYGVAKLKSGEPIFTVLTRAQIDKARGRSRAGKSGPWVTDYIAMARKTAIRRLWKWLPKSTEMATAAAIDEAPEIGQPQAQHWAPETADALEGQGLNPFELEAGSPDTVSSDPSNEAQLRQPGED